MDPAYLIGSVAGIALLVGLNILLFGRAAARIDAEAVAAQLALEVPGFRAGSSTVSADSSAALIENKADRSLYLACVRGDKFAIRKVSKGALRTIICDDGTLNLRFTDFTFPKAAFQFHRADDASAWEARVRRAGG